MFGIKESHLRLKPIFSLLFILLSSNLLSGQTTEHSVARKWMDEIIGYIPEDGQGPTIHARNMFHASAAMYDAWAFYDKQADEYLLGKNLGNFKSELQEFEVPEMNVDSAQQVAISYAAFRVMLYRLNLYGSKTRTVDYFIELFEELNLDPNYRSTDYMSGSPAALGNYIAQEYIRYGDQDGSQEEERHENFYYEPVNRVLEPNKPGNPTISNPNRWQPITVHKYVDAKGLDETLPVWNHIFVVTQDLFMTPEWGNVLPFALTQSDLTNYERGGDFKVYLDPGAPPHLNKDGNDAGSERYKQGFALNAVWSSFADPSDSVIIDISPSALGSQPELPKDEADYQGFYDMLKGGVKNTKPHKVNPFTGKPYEPNRVLRGDYVRVISEYWVDAINTYSPPGHWVDHLIQTSYDPNFKRQWKGKGPELSRLEWDVKSFFTMAGTMHDAAIACWGVKGYYDYVRPISAIRYMSDKGQSSDASLPRYHAHGIPLIDNHIELVLEDDPLVGGEKENLNKIKIRAWRGPDSVSNAFTDVAGVGWILAENWWPYQRYSFVTPNFAGYVSGHSTFSPAGAEVLTQITGDPYFPGGLHTFTAKKNEFLEFEDGPTQDVTLQWATYHDAAAETCLSRIYGGIHPPADDIPGRKMGIKVAHKTISKAEGLFKP